MAFNPVGTLSGFLGGQASPVQGVGTYNPTAQTGDLSSSNPNYQPVPGQPGKYYDTASGQILTQDPTTGAINVTAAPNANQLTAQNVTQAQGIQAQQQQGLANIANNQTQMTGLAGSYQNTINNPNAPSSAQSQLTTGLNAITGQQEGIAAGASGNNSPVAQRQMAQNIAGAQIAENGQASLLRAGEVANAQSGEANVLGTQGSQLGSLYGTQGAQAVGYTNTAAQNQGNVLSTQEKNNEFNATQNSSLVGNLGGAITGIASSL